MSLSSNFRNTDNRDKGNSVSRPIRNNNPYALINKSSKIDDWNGLAGDDNGFLTFKSKDFGTRAGLIVIYNGYIKQGLITPRSFISKYAPAFENDVDQYAKYLADSIGIGIDDPIEQCNWRKIALKIPQYESGDAGYINEDDLDRGLQLAKNHPAYPNLYPFFSKECGKKDYAGFNYRNLVVRVIVPILAIIVIALFIKLLIKK